MTVTESLSARRSIRAFLPKQVEPEKLAALFAAAARTPSWANTQPWEVFVATGETMERVRAGYLAHHAERAPVSPETPHPTQWTDLAKQLQRELGADMKTACGEAVGEFGALSRALFRAPCAIYLCMDRLHGPWSMFDLGAYAQSVMLLAAEQGLATITSYTMTQFPDVLRREMQVPDNLQVVIGIALGYADPDHDINNLVTARRAVDETVRVFE